MGSVGDKIYQHRYQIALTGIGLTFAVFAKYEKDGNKQLRTVVNYINPQIPSQQKYFPLPPAILNAQNICEEFIKYKKYPIFRVALTGGPCAGKSTALQKIQKHFSASGFKVLMVPEVPTIVGLGGGLSDFGKYGSEQKIRFQTDLIKFKMYLEDYIAKMAEMSKHPCLILCDRGIADCAAYMSNEEYQAVLDEEAWTWSGIRDKRYDSVIFMNTAADGAQQHYTLANNAARSQTPEQARALDKKTLNAWIGHPYMTICPNIKGKSFDYKVELAIKAVEKTIGLESTEIIYHKFLVQVGQFPENVVKIVSNVEEIYLTNENPRFIQDKIKKRGQDNSYTYQRKFVGLYDPSERYREVVRTSLNSLQYATLSENEADPYFRPIHIKRINFTWNNTYFSLDQHDYIKDNKGCILLRFQAGTDRDISQIIPPWIKAIRDVRSEPQFSLSKISYREY